MTHSFLASLAEFENNAGVSKDEDAAKYFEPLRLACESKQPRLMEISLDAIHYLIGMLSIIVYLHFYSLYLEHGYLRVQTASNVLHGESQTESEKEKQSSMELLIKTVSSCADEYDEVVQLEVRSCVSFRGCSYIFRVTGH